MNHIQIRYPQLGVSRFGLGILLELQVIHYLAPLAQRLRKWQSLEL